MNYLSIVEDIFGTLKKSDGSLAQTVKQFTLSNGLMTVEVINYGACITSLKVPDKFGNTADVVLGFDCVEDYINHPYYFGCTVGRVANRIANGCFKILNQEYKLAANNGQHHLHGGCCGFDKVIWDFHVKGNKVIFSYTSPAWEENYPGTLYCEVSYEATVQNELVIRYYATASDLTPVNLTNHSYFNLGGHGSGPIYDHTISINADYYTPVNDALIPTGVIAPVNDTFYDLRQPKLLESLLSGLLSDGIDLNFCVNGNVNEQRLVSRVQHTISGRVLEIYSTQPGVQFYTGNFLPTDDTSKGKGGKIYKRHGGLCLETQNYPDAINHPNFPNCLLGPDEEYIQTTIYKFLSE